VTDRSPSLVVVPGMSDGEGLKNAAKGLPGSGAEQEMEMIRHQTIAEEAERVTSLRLGQGLQEREVILGGEEDGSAVVAAVNRMIEEAVRDRSRRSRHEGKVQGCQEINELTPVSPPLGAAKAA